MPLLGVRGELDSTIRLSGYLPQGAALRGVVVDARTVLNEC